MELPENARLVPKAEPEGEAGYPKTYLRINGYQAEAEGRTRRLQALEVQAQSLRRFVWEPWRLQTPTAITRSQAP